jgi:hypothetical protein
MPSSDSASQYPDGSFAHSGIYEIDPDTILESLDRGETDVFYPESETPQIPSTTKSVSWNQAEYQKIVDALSQFVWKESMIDWKLYRLFFRRGCQDIASGFVYADFTFFKEISIKGKKLYTVRSVFVSPQSKEIRWGGDTNFPRPLWGWKSIDSEKIIVTAEEAVVRADEIGGKSLRISVQNQCQIKVDYFPENYDYDGWRVSYDINPYSPSDFILVPAK